jgi:hypothetical protein
LSLLPIDLDYGNKKLIDGFANVVKEKKLKRFSLK